MNIMVVGLGSMGKRRIRLLQRFSEVELIIGIDAREDRRNEAYEQYNIDTYKTVEYAIEKNNIDSAFVCTSPISHGTIVTSLLSLGLNVFTEINLIEDRYETNIKLANEKNLTLFLSSTFYYREEIKYIRNKIKNKSNLNYVYHVGQYLPDWHPWEKYNDFFVGDKKTNGCRELMAIEFPWIIGTFGNVKKLSVISDKITELSINYNDNYMMLLEHENGNKGTFIIDVVSPKAVRNLEVYGENLYYSWNGLPSSLEEYNSLTKSVEKVILDEETEHIEGYGSFIIENAYQNEIREFIEVVKGNKKPVYGFKEDKEILRLIDKIEGIENQKDNV